MVSRLIIDILSIIYGYLNTYYEKDEVKIIEKEIKCILGKSIETESQKNNYSYQDIQVILSTLNEKEHVRKKNGVYYTPNDIVEFIVNNAIKYNAGKLNSRNLGKFTLKSFKDEKKILDKTFFDPTCGAGVFLFACLELKINLLKKSEQMITIDMVKRIVSTIYGNDLNKESILIVKIRFLLLLLKEFGPQYVIGISSTMEKNFTFFDYVDRNVKYSQKYDVILGNPPYVESSKTKSNLDVNYGNIYANVLEGACKQLKSDGVLGFIIPLSYISTPRMKKVRELVSRYIPEQYIMSYSDRPDCLFVGVHQKLCIILGKKTCSRGNKIYTSNYQYWYKGERGNLFKRTNVIENRHIKEEYIPKLGNCFDDRIYRKIQKQNTSFLEMLNEKKTPIYINMRAAFWVKAFLKEHTGGEYKEYFCKNAAMAALAFCLTNSTLFWWYWIAVSDCWHITRKELQGFKIPDKFDENKVTYLAERLEDELEKTKLYVGTKQTEYEYKHKDCIEIIQEVDDYICDLYELTAREKEYIKNFNYTYRFSKGVKNESC